MSDPPSKDPRPLSYARPAGPPSRVCWLGTLSIVMVVVWLPLVLLWMHGRSGFFERIWPLDVAVPLAGLALGAIGLRGSNRHVCENAVVGLILNGLALAVMAGIITVLASIGQVGPP